MELDKQPTDSLGMLAALSQKPEVPNLWFYDREIVLDGYKFVNCRFDRCKLQARSTNFEIEGCFIDEESVFLFIGETVKIVRAFNIKNKWMYEHGAFFAPHRFKDGRVSIYSGTDKIDEHNNPDYQ